MKEDENDAKEKKEEKALRKKGLWKERKSVRIIKRNERNKKIRVCRKKKERMNERSLGWFLCLMGYQPFLVI